MNEFQQKIFAAGLGARRRQRIIVGEPRLPLPKVPAVLGVFLITYLIACVLSIYSE